jgi:hypothetical protein
MMEQPNGASRDKRNRWPMSGNRLNEWATEIDRLGIQKEKGGPVKGGLQPEGSFPISERRWPRC